MEKLQLRLPLPSQGLNLLDDSLIGDSEAADGTVNISFRDGQPQTRKGYAKQGLYEHAGEAAPITRLAFHLVDTKDRMLFCSGGHLYQMNPDVTPVRRDLGAIAGTKPNTLPVACAFGVSYPYTAKVLVADGTAFKWFDESHTLTDVPPYDPTVEEIAAYGTNVLSSAAWEINGQKYILNDDNRIWLAGYGTLVRVSHLGTSGVMPDYWPSAQVFRLPSDCTGMVKFMGEVLLFTETEAYLVSGSTPVFSMDGFYVNTALPGGYGCSQHDSIATGDNAVYWANRSGVYRYRYMPSGFSIPECVSEFTLNAGNNGGLHTRTIRPLIEAITDWTKVFAVFVGHEYRLFLGDSRVLCFDTVASTWALHDYAADMACAAAKGHVLYCGSRTPYETFHHVYEMDKGLSDDGLAFTATLSSKVFDFDRAANKKRFRRLFLSLYSENAPYDMDVTVTVDGTPTTTESAVVHLVTDPKTNLNHLVKVKHTGKKYTFKYALETTTAGNAWLLLDAVLLMRLKDLR